TLFFSCSPNSVISSFPSVSVLLCAGFLVTAIQREDLFQYGPGSGDSVLQDGDDETSEVVKLERRLYFYEAEFSELYVGTNGIISMQDFPRETQYVDDGFPTEFPVIAPFLADIDTSVPHRVNGKVSGQISVGIAQVDLSNMDLHAYVVVSDGRAYTAISDVPEPAGWALMPVSTIGGLFGWLFALELPNHENGFSIAGAIFTRYAEITFYPGNEKLRVTQEVKGLDAENHLTVHTQIHGHVPFVPPGATVQIEPFKEIYHYHPSVVTSTSTQEYKVISAGGHSETFSYRISQNISYYECRHAPKTVPNAQQLRLERVFVLYSKDEQVLRYAITNQIGPVGGDPKPVVENPCYSGTHECDMTAQCIPGDGLQYQCQCATGYRGDGTNCFDIDECAEGLVSCGSQALCINLQGTHRCECRRGYEFASDGRTCVGKIACHTHRSPFLSAILASFVSFLDVDECNHHNCHPHATCHNTPGSYNCRCLGGYDGDGFQCTPHPDVPSRLKTACEQHRDNLQAELNQRGSQPNVGAYIPQCDEEGNYRPLQCHGSTGYCWCVDSRGQERPGTRTPPGSTLSVCVVPETTLRPKTVSTMCERWRSSLLEHYGGQPAPHHYIPQCDDLGNFSPLQCYGDNSYCWCVDAQGREVSGTRSHSGIIPACLPTVPPPTLQPTPRPDVTPPPLGTVLLYAQGQQIGSLPLNGTRINKEKAAVVLALHGSIVVGIDYDCRERMVYWTDVAGRTISKASLQAGSEPEIIINSGLLSPEGLAVDHVRRKMFWVDSGMDKIETARLDGTERRVLFDTDLVNPRAIVVDSHRGNLYWTDWNREAPKIETSTLDGENRRVLVSRDIGLPNALTFDYFRKQICWADAGTKRLECILPDGSGRHAIHSNLNYPFGMTVHSNHFYYTDWRRYVSNLGSLQLTDEYLPDQRSHLYGITVALPRCFYGKRTSAGLNVGLGFSFSRLLFKLTSSHIVL
uniref:Nidogen 2 n=1 Tax=Erpetoichthys calabaricus TaxID=27687 RepID=A0A8C4SRN2_ERPCA